MKYNTEIGNPTRKIINIPVDKGIICLRGLSPQRLRFEIEYGLERGTTANSFLIEEGINSAGQKYPGILIHPPGENFSHGFIKELRQLIPNTNNEFHIIVGHVNPNRVALLKELATIYDNLLLICSAPATKLIQELWSQKKPTKLDDQTSQIKPAPTIPRIQTIKKQESIEVGCNYEILLIPAPTARWPGSLLAFEKNLGLLMSDKFFAAHICTDNWAENNRSSTEEDRRHYFDSLMSSMSNQIDTLVEKLEELDIRTIAPGHGPAIEGSWRSLLNDYRQWGEGQKQSSIKVILMYASAYGNTAAIADALANGISRTGIKVESVNCEFIEPKELLKGIKEADAYLIGSPTLGGHAPTPIVSALGTLLAEGDKAKPIGIFGSYGWSGEALDLLENKLRDGGFKFGFEPIKIKFSPNPSTLKTLEETGTIFGRNLRRKNIKQQYRTTTGISGSRNDPAMIALGRIVGSLCVLTTRKGEGNNLLSGAMIASWISQASFSPPGISIAVAKDRAIETLLHCGDNFTLNVLAKGREKDLLRQFLRPFKPGEDRFKGLTLAQSPTSQPILPDALAWLEGCVEQRMECSDHWLIYAVIHNGKVLDAEGTTAVHHRKTGANY